MNTSDSSEAPPQALVPNLRFPEFRAAGEWVEKKLGDVCEILNNRRRPITSSGRKPGPYRYYGASGVVDYVDDFIFDERVILVGEDGAKWGAFERTAFIVEGRFWVNNHAHVLQPKGVSDVLLTAYLSMTDLAPFVTGAAPPKLTLGKLKEIPVPIPRVESEGRAIADCLSSLDELLDAQARKVEALKTHKKGLMEQLFPREGETQPRLRFPEFREAGEWAPTPLLGLFRMQAGRFVSAADISEQNAVGLFPCYGGNGLRGFTVTFTHDGLYPLIGRQGALCGNTTLARGKFHATEHAVVVSAKPGVNVVWAYYLLSLLNLNRFATGQAQPGLSVDVLEQVPATIPNRESEQRRIADCLSNLDDLIAAEIRTHEALKTHKKGLMQQLFPSPQAVEHP